MNDSLEARHDVFVSYASEDKVLADAIVSKLEVRGVRCWYAPRDIGAGQEYGTAIVDAIHQARVMVLVLSASSNRSAHVPKEVERAVDHELHLIPFRIEYIKPSANLEYFVSSRHWLDALPPPALAHVDKLVEAVVKTLGVSTVTEDYAEAPPKGPKAPPRGPRRKTLAGIVAALVLVAAGAWYFDWPPDSSVDASTPEAGTEPGAGREGPGEDVKVPGETEHRVEEKKDESTEDESTEDEITEDEITEDEITEDEPLPVGPEHEADPSASLESVEGIVGGDEARFAEHVLVMPDHGFLELVVSNENAPGTPDSTIRRIVVDHVDAGWAGPGTQWRWSRRTVEKGQQLSLEVVAEAGHTARYELVPKFTALENAGLVLAAGDGVLESAEQGVLGFGHDDGDEWVYEPVENGRLQVALTNRVPAGTVGAAIESLSIDGQRISHANPGESPISGWMTVVRGRPVTIGIEAQPKSNVVYTLTPRFESLASMSLTEAEGGGELTGQAKGTLGFGRDGSDEWSFEPPENGRLQISVTNDVDPGTVHALILSISVDGQQIGHLPPGQPRRSPWVTVVGGRPVVVRVEAQPENNVVYTLTPMFESLATMSLTEADGGGELTGQAKGTLGFGRDDSDEWTFEPPENGRLSFEVKNDSLQGTGKAAIEFFSIDGRRMSHANPGVSPSSPWTTVEKGRPVTVRVQALPENNVVYTLTPKFESLATMSITEVEGGDELTGQAKGTLGFGRDASDSWTYEALEHGRLQVSLTNDMPVGTDRAVVQTFAINEQSVRFANPGQLVHSHWLTVEKGQSVTVLVEAQPTNNVVYTITPVFEPNGP